MFKDRTQHPGLQTCPKMENLNASGALTPLRLYMIPLPNPTHTQFDRYYFDINVTPANGSIDFTCAIYERVGSISAPSGIIAQQIVATASVTANIISNFTYVTLSNQTLYTLPPGDYWIGWMYNRTDVATIASPTACSINASVTGDYIYQDQVVFTLPATLTTASYIHQASENPIWGAIGLSGDAIK